MSTRQTIAEVDAIFASVGLQHGRRASRKGAWSSGERTGVGTGAIRRPRLAAAAQGPSIVQIPGWDKLPWLRHGFSTRLGGASKVYGPGELNLGWTAADNPKLVSKNRRILQRAVGAPRMPLVALRQSHTGIIHAIHHIDHPFATPEGKAILRGDGIMTGISGILLAVQVADCVPVLVVDKKNRAVAAFHAGWRSTLKRIVERGIGSMRLQYGSRPQDLIAAIGPAIGPCCYAVGEEVRHDFLSQFAYAEALFSEVYDSDPVREKYPLLFLTARAPGHSPIGPQLHIDLWEANRRQLLDAGLSARNITVTGQCTACATTPSGGRKYFSHRADHGFGGRMMGVIAIA